MKLKCTLILLCDKSLLVEEAKNIQMVPLIEFQPDILSFQEIKFHRGKRKEVGERRKINPSKFREGYIIMYRCVSHQGATNIK